MPCMGLAWARPGAAGGAGWVGVGHPGNATVLVAQTTQAHNCCSWAPPGLLRPPTDYPAIM